MAEALHDHQSRFQENWASKQLIAMAFRKLGHVVLAIGSMLHLPQVAFREHRSESLLANGAIFGRISWRL